MITLKDEETEAQTGEVTCPRSHSWEVVDLGFDREAGSSVVILANKLCCLFWVHKDSPTFQPIFSEITPFPCPHWTGAFKAEYGTLIN